MFDTVLVANRGEIALRVMRTLRRMAIRSVAVYTDADVASPHVAAAEASVHIGPSYLDIGRIIDAARQTGAEAIHPGYGFLSENATFARACADAGIVFIGPPASAIEMMGDKIAAKRAVTAVGVPVVPGRFEPNMSDDQLVAAAVEVGFPVLLKPSAGGGGKGMRQVRAADELRAAIESARREAAAAFGDDTLMVERYVDTPRHIEIQVLADTYGTVLHLGERECSLQRRHQKIIEEAPSPLLTGLPGGAEIRRRMGQAAVDAAKAAGYIGAGTVEFVVSTADPGEFFFLEMNTRLQVEHPVTEQVTGIDLVAQQILVAAGQRLSLRQEDVRVTGHAVEARVYAEDPARGFLPTGGRILALAEPADLVRVDSSLAEGVVIGSDYDPMLAKYIAHADSRDEALRELRRALGSATVLGVTTNIDFLRRLLADPEVLAGNLDTGLVERRLDTLVDTDLPVEVLVAAALERALALEPSTGDSGRVDPWDLPGGWRLGGRAWTTWLIGVAGGASIQVMVRGQAFAAEVAIGDGEPQPATARWADGALVVEYAGRTRRYACAREDGVCWLGAEGRAWALTETEPLAAVAVDRTATAGPVTSPMPGTVLVVRASRGDRVAAGTPLVIVEAMKMEHTVTAPMDGVVAELPVRAGQRVRLDELLAVIEPEVRS
ncbi:MAG TPA: biotin carboxylase N-terminal domain-containing protein [Pseudonocardiaceae bacterium]|nr:biotin carboxylase N-terminal domain-containing protein [Pseudonocardiaceae bacterium]